MSRYFMALSVGLDRKNALVDLRDQLLQIRDGCESGADFTIEIFEDLWSIYHRHEKRSVICPL